MYLGASLLSPGHESNRVMGQPAQDRHHFVKASCAASQRVERLKAGEHVERVNRDRLFEGSEGGICLRIAIDDYPQSLRASLIPGAE